VKNPSHKILNNMSSKKSLAGLWSLASYPLEQLPSFKFLQDTRPFACSNSMTINGTTTSEAAAVLCLVCLYIFLFKLLPKHKNQKTTTSRHYAIDFKYLRQNKTCTQWKCALSSPTHFLLTAPLKSTSLPKNYGTKASKQRAFQSLIHKLPVVG
jgi:hypothetical protein